MEFSVVVITRNRRRIVSGLLDGLFKLRGGGVEILVVDNASADGTSEAIRAAYPGVHCITLDSNRGAVARNFGMSRATGRYIITLDDDVGGLNDKALDEIERCFRENPKLAAVNFKILDSSTREVANWCHPYRVEEFADREFMTCEISEGAVAFRRTVLEEVGRYPEVFFISNEGADLVCRLLNRGYDIAYCPEVVVHHQFSEESREPWRRYYYDTRNHFWLALRNYRAGFGIRYVIAKTAIMMVYAIRDGYLRYWAKGIIDALRRSREIYRGRDPLTPEAEKRLKSLRQQRPGFVYLFRKRLGSRTVRI